MALKQQTIETGSQLNPCYSHWREDLYLSKDIFSVAEKGAQLSLNWS